MAEPILDWKTHVTIIAGALGLGALVAASARPGWPLSVSVTLGAAVATAAFAMVVPSPGAKRILWIAAALLLVAGAALYVTSP